MVSALQDPLRLTIYCSVADSDITLCVLSVPDIAIDAGCNDPAPILSIPEDVLREIVPEKTCVLLNKRDLALSQDSSHIRTLESCVAGLLGITHIWTISLTASTGVDSFLRNFGDVLRERLVSSRCSDGRDIAPTLNVSCT